LKKKIASLCAVLLLLFVTAVPAYASEEVDEPATATESTTGSVTEAGYHHVLDSGNVLSEENSRKIEEAAAEVYARNGVELFAYVTGGKLSKPDDTGKSIYSSDARTDAAVIMMADSKNSYIRAYGRAANIFSSTELKNILKQAKKKNGKAERLLEFVSLTGSSLEEKGVLPIPEGRLQPRLVDEANLLSHAQQHTLLTKLDEISEKWQLDVVVVTNHSLEGKTVEAFADDFYDYNGYGFGQEKDGILLLVSMDTREWAISTCGRAINIFTDSRQANMSDTFVSYLGDGDYNGAFVRFANMCNNYMDYDANQSNVDQTTTRTRSPFGWFGAIFWSSAVGMVVGLIVALSLRSQLTSVKPQTMATAYTKPGSLKITDRTDLFLYHNITRVPIPRDSDSGSGSRSHHSSSHSSTHTSSSGRSHGGSHGHF
jgi:Beta-propeller domains of methanol dehydrogenase type